ncbi:MAG TPA: formyltransferase family protein [Thermomicrobiales bacterium]|nr:formyltransferase family protein [Thermomicrobiales bacterium]
MVRDEIPVEAESWRVVVFSVLPARLVYLMLDELLRSLGHRIVGVVTSPGPKRRRSDAYLDVVVAARPGVDVIVSNHPEHWAAMLAPLRPDLIVCGGFPWLIPADVLALPRLGAINLHPARLPRHRGPGSVEWAFRNGDPEIGFTIHRIADDFDNGPILAQGGVPIDDDDDFDTLMPKLGALIPDLIRVALNRVARGEAGEPQDESQASYAGLFDAEWRIIDWNRPARLIHNQVRSWTGVRDIPRGALGQIDGATLQIVKTRLLPPAPASAAPGTLLRRDAERLVVQCADGPLAVVAWNVVAGDAERS